MALVANITTPFGASVEHHEVARIEGLLTDSFVSVLVHSWPTSNDCAAHGRKGATYIWPVSLPVEAILAATGTLAQRCEAALIAVEDQANPFYGAAAAPSVTDLETAKAAKWANIKQTRTLLDEAPIALRDFEIDADQKSRQDIMGAVMAMQLTGQTSRLWRCTDNTMRELTLADLVDVGTAIAARRQSLIETSDALYQALQGAETVEDVEAVVWPQELASIALPS